MSVLAHLDIQEAPYKRITKDQGLLEPYFLQATGRAMDITLIYLEKFKNLFCVRSTAMLVYLLI